MNNLLLSVVEAKFEFTKWRYGRVLKKRCLLSFDHSNMVLLKMLVIFFNCVFFHYIQYIFHDIDRTVFHKIGKNCPWAFTWEGKGHLLA